MSKKKLAVMNDSLDDIVTDEAKKDPRWREKAATCRATGWDQINLHRLPSCGAPAAPAHGTVCQCVECRRERACRSVEKQKAGDDPNLVIG